MSSINLLTLLPETIIQDSISQHSSYSNIEALYDLSVNVRHSVLDLIMLNKLDISEKIYGTGDITGYSDFVYTPSEIDTENSLSSYITRFSNKEIIYYTDHRGKLPNKDQYIYIKTPQFDNYYVLGASEMTKVNRSMFSDGKFVSYQLMYSPAKIISRTGDYILMSDGNACYIDKHLKWLTVDRRYMGNRKIIKIKIIPGRYTDLLLTDDGNVYAVGDNIYGIYDNNRHLLEQNYYTTVPIPIIDSNGVDRVIDMRNGLFLTENGNVFIFRQSVEGDEFEMNRSTIPISATLRDLSLNDKIISLSSGNNSMRLSEVYVITESGNAFKYNPKTNQLTAVDKTNMGNEKIVSISNSDLHTVYLTASGNAYTSGSYLNGVLGIGKLEVDMSGLDDYLEDFSDDDARENYIFDYIYIEEREMGSSIPIPIDRTNIGRRRIKKVVAKTDATYFYT